MALATLSLVSGTLFAASTALAVHDAGVFELDANADSDAAPGVDWDAIFADMPPPCTGTVACSFTSEALNTTIFTGGGSKDDLDTTGWKHKNGSVPDKNDLADAYAARYTVANYPTNPGPSAEILYFGADRLSNDGDAFMGFWFFQGNVTALPGGTFGPAAHQDGDILVISDFSGGGDTVGLAVYRWNGPGGSIAGSGAINGTLDELIPFGSADCANVGPGDPACATVNDGVTNAPWPFLDKGGSADFRQGEFIEGGINLSFLNLGDRCFSSFLAETRSSTSVNAVLKDFVGGQFAVCGATMTTDASTNLFGIGGSVTDSATITVTGSGTPPAPTGVVSFYVCGPTAGITSCTAAGTAAGTPNLSTAVKVGNNYTVSSSSVTPTTAGDYCFFATWPGDTNYPAGASVTNFSDECFTVSPRQPTISTQVNNAGPAPLGTLLSDTATLGNTAPDPDASAADGTITFTAYGPHANTTTCTTVAYTQVVNVSGNGQYVASFTPTTAGTYNWIAVYSGDPPNTLGVSGACGDANEGSVIAPNQPTITTDATADPPTGAPLGTAISDTATLSGTAADPDASVADGTITFSLYGPNDATCANPAIFTSVKNVAGDGPYVSDEFTPTAAGTYRWIAVYSGDAPNTLGVSGACNDANEASLIISLTPVITTGQFFYPNDAATVTVASGGGNLAGTVRLRVWTNITCTGTPLIDQSRDIVTNGTGTGIARTVETTNTTVRVSATTNLYWQVDYDSTNGAHQDVTGACGTENSILTINNG